MPHKELTSKADFDAAVETKDRYVLIYAYSGQVHENAEKAAERHASNTDAYKVDVEKYPTAKDYFKLSQFPAVVVFKNGEELKKLEDLTPEKAKTIADVLV